MGRWRGGCFGSALRPRASSIAWILSNANAIACLKNAELTGSALLKARRQIAKDALEFLNGKRPNLAGDVAVETALLDSAANVLCPACKLWNTGSWREHDARSR